MNIGFVGLGKMGIGMARNLLKAGHRVCVYNRTRARAEPLIEDGAIAANSPAEASRNADAVFTMLADDPAVSDAVFGDGGIVAGLPERAVHLSSSTISVAFARQLNDEHRKHGQSFVSAPVFGRPEAAEAKKLIVLLAGDEQSIARCRPLAEAIGRETFIVGKQPWQANAVKLCGNFMIASMLETFSEAFAVLRKSVIDEHLFLNVMVELFGSPVYKNYGSTIADRKFDPAGFGLKLGLKDIRQVVGLSEEASAPMPFASILRDRLLSAMANGQEHLDWSSMSLLAARDAGLT
jgi:3-hydroxyisobutyrate dehydrogenase-like beta-hydroxyacid dehydrogenase